MNIFDAIEKRQSYRGSFSDEKPEKEDLIKIVNAGILAPSGKNAQTTDFIIVDDPYIAQEINQMGTSNTALKEAKAFILCISDKNPKPSFADMEFTTEDASSATTQMLLAITALGYASVWIDGWLRLENRAEKIAKLVKLPDEKIIRIILPVGIPTQDYASPAKKSFAERAFFNKYPD